MAQKKVTMMRRLTKMKMGLLPKLKIKPMTKMEMKMKMEHRLRHRLRITVWPKL